MDVWYLVERDYEDGEGHNTYCDTYEEAVEYANRQTCECGIYQLVAFKEKNGRITEEKKNDKFRKNN